MNINTSNVKNAEISKFQKIVQMLIIIMFVPIMLISVFSIYVYSSTKSSSSLPSGFGLHVITVPEEIDLFSAGQKIVVKEVDTSNIKINDYIAFFVATEEPTETGSEIAFKKVLEIIEDGGIRRFRFANEMYYQIENAVIGIYHNESAFIIGILSFFSADLVVVLMALIPLLTLLILLGLYIIEQFSVTRLNKDIKLALAKAESAGFDTNINDFANLEPLGKVEEKESVLPLLSKKAQIAHIKAKMPPRKAPVNMNLINEETIAQKTIAKEDVAKVPNTVLPAKKAPNTNLPPKKAPILPPKKAPNGKLPPKKENWLL